MGSLLYVLVISQVGGIHFPILHRTCNDAALATDGLVTKVIKPIISTCHICCALLDGKLELIKHLEIRLVEHVTLGVDARARSQPEGVDPEERSKLLLEVVLLQVGARSGWNPQFLGVVCDLNIHETKEAKGKKHKPCEHEGKRMTAHHQTESIGQGFKHTDILL